MDRSNLQVTSSREPRRGLFRVSIRAILVIVAIVALGLTGYRRWRAERTILAHTYPVADLVPNEGSSGREYVGLLAEIKAAARRRNWFGPSGEEFAAEFLLSRSILVRDNRFGHDEIAELLARKRAAAGQRP